MKKSIISGFGLLLLTATLSVSGANGYMCAFDGVSYNCTDPRYRNTEPKFEYCRMGDYVLVEAQWCFAQGGQWTANACVGSTTPVIEGNFRELANTAEMGYTQACSALTTETGWGVPMVPSTCDSGGVTEYKGKLKSKELNKWMWQPYGRNQQQCQTEMNGAAAYVMIRKYDVGCPPGFREHGQGQDMVCIQPIPEDPPPKEPPVPPVPTPPEDPPSAPPDDKAPDGGGDPPPLGRCPEGQRNDSGNMWGSKQGNPVDIATGGKVEVETDYASSCTGGLTFARFYTSAPGSFVSTGDYFTNEDFWRYGYYSRVVEYIGNPLAMASVQGRDGTPVFFGPTGEELGTKKTARSKLERLTSGGALTGWRHTATDGDVRSFDAAGRIVSMVGVTGHSINLAYDPQSRVSTMTDSFGRSITLGYDSTGRLVSMTDPSNRTTSYGYDSQGRLTTVTRPDSSYRTYLYEDPKWRFALTGIIDERQIRISTYTYDVSGRVATTERTGPIDRLTITYLDGPTTSTRKVIDGFSTEHNYVYDVSTGVSRMKSHTSIVFGIASAAYDSGGSLQSRTDRRGNVTTYVYDPVRNLETSRTEGAGTSLARTITTVWHSTLSKPAQITEPSSVPGVNRVTTIAYDTMGNVLQRQVTAGSLARTWNYTYNSYGQVLTANGPRTDVVDLTTYTYHTANDPCVGCRGQLATVTNPAGHVTSYTSYNADGRPLTVVDANGVTATFAYNSRGWIESSSKAGDSVTYEYDAAGRVTKTTLQDGSWVRSAYNAAGLLIGLDDALGNSLDYERDARGNIVREDAYDPQDQLKRRVQRVYDGGNRLARELDGLSHATVYQRDNNGNVNRITDPLFRESTATHDVFNRRTTFTDAALGVTTVTYTPADEIATVKDPKNLITTYTRDGLGNVISISSPDSGLTTFTHDAVGNVLTKTDARSLTTTYSYDPLGRVLSALVTDGNVSYQYDNLSTGGSYAKGKITRIDDPSGYTTWSYDSAGRVLSRTQVIGQAPNSKSFAVGYTYSQGRLATLTLPSGRVVAYGYNVQGQVASIAVDNSILLSGVTYTPFGGVARWNWSNNQVYERTYDLDGRVTHVTLGPDSAVYSELAQIFGYDALNRLITAQLAAGQVHSYGYDANGNRTSQTVNGAVTNYVYPAGTHRLSTLTGATARTFTYDAMGSVLGSSGLTREYDGRGRMKRAGTTDYLVNGHGQRVAKKVDGVLRHFIYGLANELLGEYDETGALVQETIWLGTSPVATSRTAAPAAFQPFYVWADNLGTPRAVSNASGALRWSWNPTEPFGNSPPQDDPQGLGAFEYNLRLPGQYYDAETGLHYNYFRDYDPRIGRYIESDPIGLLGGLNTFSYVGASPLSEIDRLGLQHTPGRKWPWWLPFPDPKPNPGAGSGQDGEMPPLPRGRDREEGRKAHCEEMCEKKFSRDKTYCGSLAALSGDPYAYVSCMRDFARPGYRKCLKDCDCL